MKNIIIAATMLLLSCSTNNSDVDNSDTNSTSNIEQNSGENISPQLNRESEDRLGVNDTMSDATETHQEKNNDLE